MIVTVKKFNLHRYVEVHKVVSRFPTGEVKKTTSTGKYILSEQIDGRFCGPLCQGSDFEVSSCSERLYQGLAESVDLVVVDASYFATVK